MIRASIFVNNEKDLVQAYEHFTRMHRVVIVRLKNKLNTTLGNVSLNFIFNQCIIGELQICYGKKPVFYQANHFLYELARAGTVLQFKHQIIH